MLAPRRHARPHRPRAARGPVLLAAACLALPLAACGGGEEPPGPGSGVEGAGASTEPQAPQRPVTATEAASAGSADDVVRRQTVRGRGDAADARVDLVVRGLRVDGRLARLRMAYTVADGEVPTEDAPSIFDLNGDSTVDVSLVDTTNLKRYSVVKAGGSASLETNVLADAPTGRPIEAQYTFAAPPEGVDAIDVQVADWPTFTGVPVQR